MPKIFAAPPLDRSASVKPLTDIHPRWNITGEYQRPPMTKVETAAARTAR